MGSNPISSGKFDERAKDLDGIFELVSEMNREETLPRTSPRWSMLIEIS